MKDPEDGIESQKSKDEDKSYSNNSHSIPVDRALQMSAKQAEFMSLFDDKDVKDMRETIVKGPNFLHPEKHDKYTEEEKKDIDGNEYEEAKGIFDEEVNRIQEIIESNISPKILNRLNSKDLIKKHLLEKLYSQDSEESNKTKSIIGFSGYSGPLPPPSYLEGYSQLIPNGPERIMVMAEKEQAHRHSMEQNQLQSEVRIGGQIVDMERRNSLIGVLSAFFIVLFTLSSATLLVYTGHDVAGTILGGTGLVSLVGTFIYGTNSSRKEKTKENDKRPITDDNKT